MLYDALNQVAALYPFSQATVHVIWLFAIASVDEILKCGIRMKAVRSAVHFYVLYSVVVCGVI